MCLIGHLQVIAHVPGPDRRPPVPTPATGHHPTGSDDPDV
jgi:hypothetical protein